MEKSTISLNKSLVDQLRKIDGKNDDERFLILLEYYKKAQSEQTELVQNIKIIKSDIEEIKKSLKSGHCATNTNNTTAYADCDKYSERNQYCAKERVQVKCAGITEQCDFLAG